ncbi:MAG: HEAT repeat domain-containing protein [Deltaproteobacteria bacterium]|nr:HEAT repeat domain-containing protein [Deltaproteobacteria bacterium]
MESKFRGKEIIEKPSCPFCGRLIERPKELKTRMPTEMPVGACDCGAVYACDVTGHNLGAAMIEALVFACNGEWDLAWDLLPEDDYLEKQVDNYDDENHLIVHSSAYQGRRISAKLYFIRLHKDIREVTEEGFRKQLEKSALTQARYSPKKREKRFFTKKDVEDLVRAYDVKSILSLAEKDTRILPDLRRLLYSAESLLRWRTADILGKASALIAARDPGAVSKLLRGLFTSIVDTAASSWGAVDAIGEIITNRPELFAGYLPELVQLTKEKTLLVEVLRALGNIAEANPHLMQKSTFRLIPLLDDSDPETRAYAAILVGNLRANEVKEDLTRLKEDKAAIEIYRSGVLEKRTIGEIASESIEKLCLVS